MAIVGLPLMTEDWNYWPFLFHLFLGLPSIEYYTKIDMESFEIFLIFLNSL